MVATAKLGLLLTAFQLPHIVLTCLSSGCGGGGCCGSSCAAPPAPCQPQQCQPGYSCGHYGCARNRARSALTRKDGLIVPIDEFLNSTVPQRNIYGVERLRGGGETRRKEIGPAKEQEDKLDYGMFLKLTNPNYLFRQCCDDRRLPDPCLGKCHFNTYTKEALQQMFFKNDRCPLEAAADLQYCAGQGRDHTSCCVRNGVHTTLAGDKCLQFCDQRPGRVVQLDYSYLPCYDRFENIKRCFYDEVKTRMETKLRPRLAEEGKLQVPPKYL